MTKLLDRLRGPNWLTLLDQAPALQREPPASFRELLDVGARELNEEAAWNERLCERVRAGEVSIENAVSAAGAHGARRSHNARMREQEYRSRRDAQRTAPDTARADTPSPTRTRTKG